MDLTWLLVMLAVFLDQQDMWPCTIGECASRKARRRIAPSLEILVVLGRPLHIVMKQNREKYGLRAHCKLIDSMAPRR